MDNDLMKQVIKSVKSKEIDGFEKLFILTYRMSYEKAFAVTRDEIDAWDIVKRVFIQIYRESEGISENEMIEKWIEDETEKISYQKMSQETLDEDTSKDKDGDLEWSMDESIQVLEEKSFLKNNVSIEEKAASVLNEAEVELGLMEDEDETKRANKIFNIIKIMSSIMIAVMAVIIVSMTTLQIKNYMVKIKLQKKEDVVLSGWVSTNQGKMYIQNNQKYTKDTWLEEEGYLYHFGKDGVMDIGEKRIGNRIFQFQNDGKLKKIRRTGIQNLEEESNRISSNGYLYYLKSNGFQYDLYRADKRDSNIDTIQKIVSKIDDFFVWNNKIYCMRQGSLNVILAEETDKFDIVEKEYHIELLDGRFFITDELGNCNTEKNGSIEIDGNQYEVMKGVIVGRKTPEITIGEAAYYLKNINGENEADIYKRDAYGNETVYLMHGIWIDSICKVDQWIYYSCYTNKDNGGEQFSRIYKVNIEEGNKLRVGRSFEGRIGNLYYDGKKQVIYGVYKESAKHTSSKIVQIDLKGEISLVDPENAFMSNNLKQDESVDIITVKEDCIYCVISGREQSNAVILKADDLIKLR